MASERSMITGLQAKESGGPSGTDQEKGDTKSTYVGKDEDVAANLPPRDFAAAAREQEGPVLDDKEEAKLDRGDGLKLTARLSASEVYAAPAQTRALSLRDPTPAVEEVPNEQAALIGMDNATQSQVPMLQPQANGDSEYLNDLLHFEQEMADAKTIENPLSAIKTHLAECEARGEHWDSEYVGRLGLAMLRQSAQDVDDPAVTKRIKRMQPRAVPHKHSGECCGGLG